MKNKQQPHVIYIITKLELGGAQKVCLNLFNNNPNASLICGSEGFLINQVKDKQNAFLLPYLVREIGWAGIVQELKAFIALVKLLWKLKQKFHHVVVHTHSTKAGLLGRWAAFLIGIKRIHTIHGFAFHEHQSWLKWTPIYLSELITSFITHHFICVSEKDRTTGARLFPFFSKKCSLIRAAVDDNYFTPAIKKRNNHFTFGTISCFKPQKNLFDLLKAFKVVHHQNIETHLEIIGDGFLKSRIKTWITKNGLQHAVTLLGWQDNVLPFLQSWDCFVLSSLWEGLPCAVVEARLQKLPVITYNTGGIAEIIHHHKNGILVTQKDWQALAKNMIKLCQNHELYQHYSAFHDQLDTFKISHMIAKHTKLYQSF